MRLDEVKDSSSLKLISLEGEEWLTSRLRELGFVPGQRFELCARLLFGDPLVIKISGTRFALRKEEAHCLHVEVESAPIPEQFEAQR